MSPLGIKRTVAILLILSPWIFMPSLFKDVIFIIAGVFLLISTLDLRKKILHHNVEHTEHTEQQENESSPKTFVNS